MSKRDIISQLRSFWNDNNLDCEGLIQNLNSPTIVPFIGAGMSARFGAPLWSSLLEELIEKECSSEDALQNELKNGEYLAVASAIDKKMNGALSNTICERFAISVGQNSSTHYIPWFIKNKIHTFVTTNYDTAIESQLSCCAGQLSVYTATDVQGGNQEPCLEAIRKGKTCVIKLHGSVGNPNSIILTQEQYNGLYKNKNNAEQLQEILKHLWTTSVFLFLGCGLSKDYLIDSIYDIAGACKEWHYAILPYISDGAKLNEKVQYLERLHIKPIWYPEGCHDAVDEILRMAYGGQRQKNQQLKTYRYRENDYLDKCGVDAYGKKKGDIIARAIFQQAITNDDCKLEELENLEKWCNDILKAQGEDALCISGDAGTGKSTLATLLYLFLKDKFKRKIGNVSYFNLERLNPDKAQEELDGYIKSTANQIKRTKANRPYILFLDGLCSYNRHSNEIINSLQAAINSWKNAKGSVQLKIVYVLSVIDEMPPFQVGLNLVPQCVKNLTLKSLVTSELEGKVNLKVKTLVENLLKIYDVRRDEQRTDYVGFFSELCMKKFGKTIDFRLIKVLIEEYNAFTGDRFGCLPGGIILKRYFEHNLYREGMKEIAKTISEFRLREDQRFNIVDIHEILYKSPVFRDFFLAYYYVSLLDAENLDDVIGRLEIFDCVFTPRANGFVVDLINNGSQTAQTVCNNLQKLYIRIVEEGERNRGEYQRMQLVQIAYLLGRIRCPERSVESARAFLKIQYISCSGRLEKMQDFVGHDSKRQYYSFLVLFRTIGVSLIYSNDRTYADDFFKKLIYHADLRKINRWFHYKYYMDEGFKIEADFPLLEADKIGEEHEMKRLYSFLSNSVKGDRTSREINIITLIDLVIFNHYKNRTNEDRDYNLHGFDELLEELVNTSSTIKSLEVQSFLKNVEGYVKERNIYSTILPDILKLKNVTREGWKQEERCGKAMESVADHSWAACMIAEVFLPERLYESNWDITEAGAAEYDKNQIIRMLVVHDFAEVYVGDIIHKTEIDREKERACFRKMDALGSFPYFSSFHRISSLGLEALKPKETTNYNAKVAHDIDKIEALIQVFGYRNELKDPEKVKNDWLNSMEMYTQVGLQILKHIQVFLFGADYNIHAANDMQ